MAMEQTRETARQQRTLVALIENLDQVVLAVRRLHDIGLTTDQISLLAKDEVAVRETIQQVGARNGAEVGPVNDVADAIEPKGRDEMAGAAIGGAVGFLVGLTAVAIPGFGAFLLAAGPVAIALHALTVGAAGVGLGALLGAILDENVTEEHRELYHRRLEEGWWMLMVHADDEALHRAADVLHETNVTHVETI